MLEALGKIVILTGSQVPIFDTRSDGLDNFLASLVIAANYSIPEVCVFFGTNLLRGNRTSKMSACSFEAFQSPNFPPLATANINIEGANPRFRDACERREIPRRAHKGCSCLSAFRSPEYLHRVASFGQAKLNGNVVTSYC